MYKFEMKSFRVHKDVYLLRKQRNFKGWIWLIGSPNFCNCCSVSAEAIRWELSERWELSVVKSTSVLKCAHLIHISFLELRKEFCLNDQILCRDLVVQPYVEREKLGKMRATLPSW